MASRPKVWFLCSEGHTKFVAPALDIFEPPVTATPQQEISKTLNSFKNSLKILNVYFP